MIKINYISTTRLHKNFFIESDNRFVIDVMLIQPMTLNGNESYNKTYYYVCEKLKSTEHRLRVGEKPHRQIKDELIFIGQELCSKKEIEHLVTKSLSGL